MQWRLADGFHREARHYMTKAFTELTEEEELEPEAGRRGRGAGQAQERARVPWSASAASWSSLACAHAGRRNHVPGASAGMARATCRGGLPSVLWAPARGGGAHRGQHCLLERHRRGHLANNSESTTAMQEHLSAPSRGMCRSSILARVRVDGHDTGH